MPGPVSEGLAAATRRLEGRADELVAAMMDALRDIPEYAAIENPAVWEEVRQHTAANVAALLQHPARGTHAAPGGNEDRAVLRAAPRGAGASRSGAARRLRQRNPDPVGRAARARSSTMPRLRDEVLERSSWAMAHLDAVTAAIADAYYEAQKDSRHRDQLVRDIFDEIVDGDASSVGALETRARLAGLDVDAELRAVVFRWDSGVPGGSPFDGLPPVPAVAACAEAAGVSAGRDPRSASRQRAAARRAVAGARGQPGTTAGDARRSADAAGRRGRRKRAPAFPDASRESPRCARPIASGARAIELGEMLDPADSVHLYDDYVLHDLFDSAPAQGDRLIAHTLEPLLAARRHGRAADRDARRLAALGPEPQGGRRRARRSTATRSTYRLEQIRRATRLDLEDPAQRLRVEAALRFLELRRRRDPRG